MQVTPHPRHLASLAQQTPGAALDASGDEEVMAEQQEREADMAAAAAQGYPLLSSTPVVTLMLNLQVGKGSMAGLARVCACAAPQVGHHVAARA